MTTVFVTGSSNVAAILQGARFAASTQVQTGGFEPAGERSWARDGITYRFPRFPREWVTAALFDETEERLSFGLPDAVSAMRDWLGEDTVKKSDVWAIASVTTTASPVLRHEMWKSFAPPGVSDADRTPLTESAVRAIVGSRQTTMRDLHARLRALGVQNIAIEGPPPRRNHRGILNGIPAETILKLDEISRVEWRSWCEDQGITSIAPPADAMDGSGFLREEYCRQPTEDGGTDHVHGNARYGALVMEQLHAVMASPRGDAHDPFQATRAPN